MADEPRAAEPVVRTERARRTWRLGTIAAIGIGIGTAAFVATRGHDVDPTPATPSAAPAPPPVTPLLDAIPQDVMIVATLDVQRLRRTRVYAMLRMSGLATVEEARTQCALDPLERLSEVGFFVPRGGAPGDFGIAASGALGAGEVLSCTAKILESRKGKPVLSNLGTFRTVRDGASTGVGELAVRDGGPVMIGAGSFLRTMIDTTDRALPPLRESKVHVALREAVGEEAVAVVTAILTEEQRAIVRDEARTLGDAGPPPIEAILAVGVGVRIDGDRAVLHGVVLVDGGRAGEVAQTVGALAKGTPYEARLKLVPEGSSVHAYLEMDLDELASLVGRLPAFSAPVPPPR